MNLDPIEAVGGWRKRGFNLRNFEAFGKLLKTSLFFVFSGCIPFLMWFCSCSCILLNLKNIQYNNHEQRKHTQTKEKCSEMQ